MADPPPDIRDVPPEEAVEFFRAKGYHIGYDWRDTKAAWHARSFTVAKVMRLDILTDIRAAVDKALAEGQTFETFQRDLAPLLIARGWWGRKTMTDPLTGETREARLGSPRRLRIIYDTNIRMAVAAGKWQRITRLADRRPWLRYVGVLDARIRPLHAARHGTVLPWDHPFWQTHFPPNGWRCRCTVQSLSEAGLERYGYHVTPPPAGWRETRPWSNARAGEIRHIPKGTSPGFDHNAGTADPVARTRTLLRERLAGAPPALARAATSDVTEWIARGRVTRQALVTATGLTPDDAGFADNLRGLVAQGPASARAAGQTGALISPATPETGADQAAAQAVHAASLRFPATWVARANIAPLRAAGNLLEAGGSYAPSVYRGRPAARTRPGLVKTDDSAWVITSRDPGNATHEYIHHLQAAMPEIDRLFQDLHIRRTTGVDGTRDAVVPLDPCTGTGRKDHYVDPCFGREYGAPMLTGLDYDPDRPAIEVMTRAFQMLFHPLAGKDGIDIDLDKLVRDDPEMLDLALGLLFHYDPP